MNCITADQILKRTENLALLDNQKEYREQLTAFIRMHTLRVHRLAEGTSPAILPTVSMLLVASTGSGKTYVTSRIAETAGVNVITIDCSSLSREGWKGVNLSNLLHNEYKKIQNKEDFETSIIFFDEVDKLRFHFSRSDEANPQYNILKIFDGEVTGDVGNHEMFTADTSRMSFVFCGAFSGLEDIIKQRTVPPSTMGFGGTVEKPVEDKDILSKVTADDLVQYGIMRELVGRIGYITHIPKLSENDYRILIKGENGSVLERYDNLFGDIAVSVDISDEACTYLAKEAGKDDLGARAIAPMVNKYMLKSVLDVESDTNINKVILNYSESEGLHTMFEYGERVRKWGGRNNKGNGRKGGTSVEIPDVNISYILQRYDGVKSSVELILSVFDTLDYGGRSLLQAFLYCCLTYLKYFSNGDDQNIGTISNLASRIGIDKDGAFDIMVNNAIKENDFADPEKKLAKKKLKSSYEKFKRALQHYPNISGLRMNIGAIREKWYSKLLRTVS